MAAQPAVDDSFTFVGGLNTEGSYFLTPKNSWKEGDNVIPSTDGSLSRRKSIDFEANYQLFDDNLTSGQIDNYAFSVSVWESVNGNGNIEYFVVQQGPEVHFYSAASGTVSASRKHFSLDLTSYQCFGNQNVVGTNVITVASCYGKLLITSVDTDPVLLVYSEETDTLTASRVVLKMRDFKGIKSPEEPQIELTEAEWTAKTPTFWPHALYNLYNQGWTNEKIDAYKTAKSNKLPSNTKQWIYGKDTSDDFDVDVLDKQDFGTSVAPKGRFVLDVFYQDRATAISTLEDTTAQTPTVPTLPNTNDDYNLLP